LLGQSLASSSVLDAGVSAVVDGVAAIFSLLALVDVEVSPFRFAVEGGMKHAVAKIFFESYLIYLRLGLGKSNQHKFPLLTHFIANYSKSQFRF
jgi:hypothetical protein